MKTQSTEQITQLNQRSRYPLKADSMIASQDFPKPLENLEAYYLIHGSLNESSPYSSNFLRI